MYTKNTKIVCTLGPASNSVSEITKLVHAGMNVARLNFSHGDYKTHKELIQNIHEVEKNTNKRIGIIQDLQGPKIRLGDLDSKEIQLKRGDIVIITTKKVHKRNILKKIIHKIKKNKTVSVPIQFKNFTKGLKKGHKILLNDGLIELEVFQVQNQEAKCLVKTSGTIKSRMGVHLPSLSGNIPTITAKDKKDLKFGLKNNVDFVALSFVKNAKDIEQLKKIIKSAKKTTKVIAKIELKSAVDNLESIVQAADGLMVARGDLGIDIPPETVPIIQKSMIRLSNKYAKPVITATEVLLSMVTNPRATRAEISDAANAIYDNTDAIMLSNESAIGKYPSRATATLSKVAESVEDELKRHKELKNINLNEGNPNCINACELATSTKANFLVVYTSDGYTAREIVKHRISTPIIVISESEKAARELTLSWGLNKIFTHKISSTKSSKIKEVTKFLKRQKIIKEGEKIVIVCHASQRERLISNLTI